MQRVIITAKREGDTEGHDLDIPAEIKAGQLSTLIAQALKWDCDQTGQLIRYRIQAELPGTPDKLLDPDKTLADESIWDGTWLIFLPQNAAPSSSSKPNQPSTENPLPPSSGITWRPIKDLPISTDETDQDEDPTSKSGFVRIPLD